MPIAFGDNNSGRAPWAPVERRSLAAFRQPAKKQMRLARSHHEVKRDENHWWLATLKARENIFPTALDQLGRAQQIAPFLSATGTVRLLHRAKPSPLMYPGPCLGATQKSFWSYPWLFFLLEMGQVAKIMHGEVIEACLNGSETYILVGYSTCCVTTTEQPQTKTANHAVSKTTNRALQKPHSLSK